MAAMPFSGAREVYRVTESLQREKSGLLKQLDFLRCVLIPEPRRAPSPPTPRQSLTCVLRKPLIPLVPSILLDG
ncbi:hypothetical protein Celaphus_00013877 [Cervus elaphus hippelaphus]|uniref:Uncharacterized protein n=1 Tax=Cervus elaphus hippelaphus TaxID=46360 RepID=A0A212CCG5_CEREH|nr:hypothetical protein Celaphus_00013877 [Cervus elaphus hippelaphus]